MEDATIDRAFGRASGAPRRTGNLVRLLKDAAENYPAWLDAIAAAEQQVLFEMYWFDSDSTGRRFAMALGEAAARGVEVALLYDSLGSITADTRMFDELRVFAFARV